MDMSSETPRHVQGSSQSGTLADRMKQYEASYDLTLPPDSPTVLRLDGHGFARFTAHFCRPFDQRIHDAMVATCADLLEFFPRATVAYTQSDELSLVFPAGVQSFNERVQKLVSLSASYCSVRFNHHLSSLLIASPEPIVKNSAYQVLATAHFDARIFIVPTVHEALNCLLWRCKGDAVRNAVNAFARTIFSTEQMHRKPTEQLRRMIQERTGKPFAASIPKWAIQGSLLKRERVQHKGFNPLSGSEEVTHRTRMRVEDRGITEFNDENLRLVTESFW